MNPHTTVLRSCAVATALALLPGLSACQPDTPGQTQPSPTRTAPTGSQSPTSSPGSSGTAGPSARLRIQGADRVLPNVDDDSGRCKVPASGEITGKLLELAACHDGADKVVNGAADAQDLTVLTIPAITDAADGASATVAIQGPGAAHSNVFLQRGAEWKLLGPKDTVDATALRSGLTLGVEATDIRRDASAWDGSLPLQVDLTEGTSKTRANKTLQVAPLLALDNTRPVQDLLAMSPDSPAGDVFQRDLKAGIKASGTGANYAPQPRGGYQDTWSQDHFEPMYASVRDPDGKQRSVRVALLVNRDDGDGLQTWFRLRGKDSGVLTIDVKTGRTMTEGMGNLEALPALSAAGKHYPEGRLLIGERKVPAVSPDPVLRTLLEAQDAQPPVYVDVSWLSVGHVDEIVQVVPSSSSPRGWTLAVSDPAAGMALLRTATAAGHGKVLSHNAPDYGPYSPPPARPIEAILADPSIVAENERATKALSATVSVLVRETGIPENEMIRVPVVYQRSVLEKGAGSGTMAPNPINSVVLDSKNLLVANQFGPKVNGKDIFAEAVQSAYGKAGMTLHWVDDYHMFHIVGGDVHCATNALRALPR